MVSGEDSRMSQLPLLLAERLITLQATAHYHLDRPDSVIHHLHVDQTDPEFGPWSSGRHLQYAIPQGQGEGGGSAMGGRQTRGV